MIVHSLSIVTNLAHPSKCTLYHTIYFTFSKSPTSSSGSSVSCHSPQFADFPPNKPVSGFADSRFSVQQIEDQSVERLRHCSESTNRGPVSMISDFSEMDNSVFSTQTKGNGIRSLRDIPDDNTMFKEPLPKVTLSRISGVSFRDRTLDMTDGLSPPNGGSEANERSSPSKSSPTNGNRTYGNIYDKTFSSSFIGNQHPHYDSINESAFEATHILEHDSKSKQRDEGQGSQYELDRLRSRMMAMEKLHTMMKNEVEIYRKMADQNKAKSDSPLLQHLEELRQTRLNLERELREKEKDFETGKLSPFKVNGYSFRGSNYHFFFIVAFCLQYLFDYKTGFYVL